MRVDAAFPARLDVLRGKVAEPGALGEGHDRDQPGVRHEIRVIEGCMRLRQAMRIMQNPAGFAIGELLY